MNSLIDLIKQAKTGDKDALQSVIDSFNNFVHAQTIKYYSLDSDDIFSVAAITIIKCVEGFDTERGDALPTTYICRSIARAVYRYAKEENLSFKTMHLDTDIYSGETECESQYDKVERAEAISQLLSSPVLTATERLILNLRYVRGLEWAAIVAQVRLSRARVGYLSKRGINKLRLKTV